MSDLSSATLIAPDDDQSMANFWKIYRFGHPKGSVQEFHAWFAHLCELQKTVELCPWCGELPCLDLFDTLWQIHCGNESCPVQPGLEYFYDTPEEAIEKWQMKAHQ